MNLQQLEYIIALDELKHFGAAADHCFVSQPTLSMMIQKLEDELGAKIFNRSKHPVLTTEIGKKIIAQARTILLETKRLDEIINETKEEIKGDFKLGIIPTLAPYLLPLFLGSFTKKYPEVRLHITELTTENIIEKLRADHLDAALLATPLQNPDLIELPLFNEMFVVFASNEEHIPAKKYLLAKDIDVNRLMLLEEGHCVRSQIINLCELRKADHFINNIRYQAGSLETLKKMVQINSGVTILPELAIWDLTEEQMEMVRYFKEPAPAREISIVTNRSYIKKRLVEALKTEILKSLPEHFNRHKDTSHIKKTIINPLENKN